MTNTFVYCRRVIAGKRPKIPRWPKTVQLKRLFAAIRKAWSQEPSERPSFTALLEEVRALLCLDALAFSSRPNLIVALFSRSWTA